jgi:hypothetical protein
MKSCNKHGYINTSPDADGCPVCRVEEALDTPDLSLPTSDELRHSLRERVSALEAERDLLANRVESARDALARCTCMCKWVAVARVALSAR